MSTRIDLIDAAIDAGLLDLADLAIQALDMAAGDPDLEAEEDGSAADETRQGEGAGVTTAERLHVLAWCRCCGQQVPHDPEFIA